MDCTDRSFYFVDILAALASRTARLIYDVGFFNLWQFNLIEEVDADKPVAAFVSRSIWILG